MNQPNFYAVIPATVRYCDALMPAAKLLYGEITALANERGYCFANNAYFSQLYHVEERQIRRWLAQLIELGFVVVKIDQSAGNQRRIYVKDALTLRTKKTAPPTDKKDLPYGQKRPHPTDKKDRTPINSSNVILQSNNVRTSDEKNQDFENQKKEKAPPNSARPPRTLFADSPFAAEPKNFWAEIKQRFPHVPAEADYNYYYQRCLDWSDSKPATSNDWPKIAAKFILDDARRGELHTTQPQPKRASHANNNRPGPTPTEQISDTTRVIERSIAIAHRLGYEIGEQPSGS